MRGKSNYKKFMYHKHKDFSYKIMRDDGELYSCIVSAYLLIVNKTFPSRVPALNCYNLLLLYFSLSVSAIAIVFS